MAFTAVGVVVVRHEPRNPIGWMLIGVALAVPAGNDGSTYADLDYTLHHGHLPLGHVALLLSSSWICALALVPLIVLLFPDGRVGPRWRWPLRGYLALFALAIAATVGITVSDFGRRMPLDGNGNVVGLQHPSGATAWLAPVLGVFGISSGGARDRRDRLPTAPLPPLERRAAPAVEVAGGRSASSASPASRRRTVLPGDSAIGGITLLRRARRAAPRHRRRDPPLPAVRDRPARSAARSPTRSSPRCWSGTFIGLIALTTNTLALSGRVGVAASTLAAAALFNPLRDPHPATCRPALQPRPLRRRGDRRSVHRAAARRGRDRRDPRRPARRRQPRRPAHPRLGLDQAVAAAARPITRRSQRAAFPGVTARVPFCGETASVTARGVRGYTPFRSSRASAATRGCVGSPLCRRTKARSSASYNVSFALRSLSASSRSPRTIPNTAWRIVAWPKARRLAASFGSSLRAGW